MVTDCNIHIDYITDPWLAARDIRLGLLRLDLLHPVISGNKWFKLKENIRFAVEQEYSSLLTFGGAWSNHLVAAAAAAKAAGLTITGIVRGLHANADLSDTLQQCRDLGMLLQPVSREDYARKDDPDYLADLRLQFDNPYLIPEGGNNEQGIKGARDIVSYLPADTTLVTLPMGTGTTFCGIGQALAEHISLLGFPVMKGGDYLHDVVAAQLPANANWQLNSGYHFGGFARHKPELILFMNNFYDQHAIPLDFVYTAKMMYGLFDLIEKNTFAAGSHIIAIHTGGLQGNRSIQDKLHFPMPG